MADPTTEPTPAPVAYTTPTAAPASDEVPLYGHIIAIVVLLAGAFALAVGMTGLFSKEAAQLATSIGRSAAPFIVLISFGFFRSTRLTTTTGFRALVCWQIGLTLATGFLAAAFEKQLPQTLQNWNTDQSSLKLSTPMFVFAVVQVTVLIAAYVGMLALWRPSRYLYIAAILLGILYSCLSPPPVHHPVAAAVDGLSEIITGALLVLLFVEPTKPLPWIKKAVLK